MASPGHTPTRLESWKEIAGYFNKVITTVQRWEKEEGLPVHRHPHQSLSSVYAYTHELDEWRAARGRKHTAVPLPAVSQPALQPKSMTRRTWVAGGAIGLVGTAVTAVVRTRGPGAAPRPLFNSSALECYPTVSADGRLILYQEAGAEPSVRLRLLDLKTGVNSVLLSAAPDAVPQVCRISPDGKLIAFLTLGGDNLWNVKVRDLAGGPIRQIGRLDGVGLDWTPDSQSLLMTTRPEQGGPVSVYAAHHIHQNRWRVSRPPAATWGDIGVAASPDGVHLAVQRYAARGDGDIWLLSFDGRVERRLTTIRTWINGLAFTPDGREIIFSPVVGHDSRLYRVSIDGKRLAEVPVPGAHGPMLPAMGESTLVFEDRFYTSRIYSGRVERQGVVDQRLVTALTTAAEGVTVSRDGATLAWIQPDGVWAAKRGDPPRRVWKNENGKRELVWSADALHLAVTIQQDQQRRIWIVDVNSGAVQRLTADSATEGCAIWSSSGAFIYWRSERLGPHRYFRRPWRSAAGEAQPVSPPATRGAPAIDDRSFFYVDNDQRSSIFEVAIGQNAPPRTLDHIPLVKPWHWEVRGGHIIHIGTSPEGNSSRFYRTPIAGGRPEPLFDLPLHPDGLHEFALSPDLAQITWSRMEQLQDVWIQEGFR